MDFKALLAKLVAGVDATRHGPEIARLTACRSKRDLDALAAGGWLSSNPQEPRLKLVKHGTGTFIVVQYVNGWSSRLGSENFPG
jgi:hypothetical protein